METVFSGPSAFKYYRTPPQVLALCHELPMSQDRATRTAFPNHPTTKAVLGQTVHTLVASKSEQTGAKYVKQHLWKGPRPSGDTYEDPVIGTLTSPLFTLLTLARDFSAIEVAMAMYELCGKFSVYEPSPEIESLLPSPQGAQRLGFGWNRVMGTDGRPSSLWTREPIIELGDLKGFVDEIKGMRGSTTFAKAAEMVLGVVRSPLEARAAMLLGLPRSRGGYGLSIQTDKVIRLGASARAMVGKDYLVADIYVESKDGRHALDIECQGEIIHSGIGARISDADRACAIEASGVDILYLTKRQLKNTDNLTLFIELVEGKLHERMPARTERMKNTEQELRYHLFQNWETLCGVS